MTESKTNAELRAEVARLEQELEHETRMVLAARRKALERAAEITKLKRALAGHLFDRESLSTREAIRVELIEQQFADLQRYRELLGSIWLYVAWRYVTKQLTTEQKEMWADAVDKSGEPGPKAERWWRDNFREEQA